jgi:iron-regulated transporter 1
MAPRVNETEDIAHSGTYLLHDSSLFQSQALSDATLKESRRLLYLSHFFNQFSENSWQFCLVLFLAAFSNYQSLILVSSYGLVSAAFVCYFGSAAGRFIDGTNRLLVAQRFIGYENCAVLLATCCCYMLLSRPVDKDDNNEINLNWLQSEGVPTDPWSIFLLVSVHILGALAKILDTGFTVAVERDWIVVMSKCTGHAGVDDSDRLERQKAWLSETNVAMKQIDLSCKVVAPAIAGVFVAFFDDASSQNRGSSLVGAALFVGILNAMALVVEYWCTAKIYHDIPSLALKRVASTVNTRDKSLVAIESGNSVEGNLKGRSWYSLQMPEGLRIYLDQDISWAGIGLSLL